MKIATDLDDVLIDYVPDLARRYNELYGTNIQPGELSPFPDIWEQVIGGGNVHRAWAITRAPTYNLSLSPIVGAKEGLEELKKLGATIYVVTHRPPEYQQSTEESITNHFPELIAEVNCVGSLEGKDTSKGEACKRIGVDCFIDDSPHNVEEVVDSGIRSLLFTQPWNSEYQTNGLITRVHGWLGDNGVVETIKKLKRI